MNDLPPYDCAWCGQRNNGPTPWCGRCGTERPPWVSLRAAGQSPPDFSATLLFIASRDDAIAALPTLIERMRPMSNDRVPVGHGIAIARGLLQAAVSLLEAARRGWED